ncbi:nucleotide sugar dehydrogenase [Anaeromicrobium sediminis]|uniref:UDP-N-acetyl-D-mannosamine dehydrogenase n=1 Tax=Anaeromicrobium sediminis TaxID=1478221 RepID=A0A267MJH9_9FIRM|nr:nucleotide sugar dehydrogenase [Anaeromicrobium sediminis]PAB59572.1 UDP-N-acetyl-D-mannosamine dehydrogenase [Anaeromicrobium sediminis]
MNKICVIGLGYIGLPTCAVLALSGYQVVGVDINKEVIKTINRGEIHIGEPNLNQIIKDMVSKKRIIAKMNPEKADAFMIDVPTPLREDKTCDLSYVISAVNSIIPYLNKGNLVIIESTIPPNTTEEVIRPIIEKAGFNVGIDVYLAHCPERVLPTKIMEEIIFNNRIIGGYTSTCAEKAEEIYINFVKGKILKTDIKTAEMSKVVENVFRDVNIALSNELAKICDRLNVDVHKVIELANNHPRVNVHHPGPGVGGHCIAVDPHFIIKKCPDLAKIISLARDINNSMPSYVVSKVNQLLDGIKSPKIAVWGITYKGNIDDVRESPALDIINLLKENHYIVTIYDPYVNNKNIEILSINDSVKDADMILILTDHDIFRELNYYKFIKNMRTPIVFDTKNIINTDDYDSQYIKVVNFGNLH